MNEHLFSPVIKDRSTPKHTVFVTMYMCAYKTQSETAENLPVANFYSPHAAIFVYRNGNV